MKRTTVGKRNNGTRASAKTGGHAGVTKSKSASSARTPKGKKPLTRADKATLQQLEMTIGGGLGSFVQVGQALKVIRDNRLYRTNHSTFQDYCGGVWRITRTYAYRQINAAVCYEQLKSTPSARAVLPLNESQLRPIVGRLKPNQWVKAWKQVVAESGSAAPTTKVVEKVVCGLLGLTGAKRGRVRAKKTREMLNTAIAKVTARVDSTLGNKRATARELRLALEYIQRRLKAAA
jgi:hypothetical protein